MAEENATNIKSPVKFMSFTGQKTGRTNEIGIPPHALLPDIPEGPLLRLEIYRRAWEKCLRRIKQLSDMVRGDAVNKANSALEDAYHNPNPLLPFPEMPTIVLTGADLPSVFRCKGEIASRTDGVTSFVSLDDCGTLQSMMKAIIAGFTLHPDTPPQPKKKASEVLSPYDINVLVAWWAAMKDKLDPPLVVVLPAIEALNPTILNDILYILSSKIPGLPLTVLTQSALISTLHSRLEHDTLTMLEVIPIDIPAGYSFLSRVLEQTFYDPHFDNDIFVEGEALANLLSYAERYDSTLDGVCSHLQVSFMHHFSNPMTIFLNEMPAAIRDTLDLSSNFVGLLRFMLLSPESETQPTPLHVTDGRARRRAISELSSQIDEARRQVQVTSLRHRAGIGILRILQEYFRSHGQQYVEEVKATLLELCISTARRKVYKKLCAMFDVLPPTAFPTLLRSLEEFVAQLPEAWRDTSDEEDFTASLKEFRNEISDDHDASEVAARFGRVLVSLFEFWFDSPEENPLTHIWQIGSRDVATDIVNPAPHTTVVAGLLNAGKILKAAGSEQVETEIYPPDTSILFERYLESPRMINVYDWLQSFAVSLEPQRKARMKKEKEEQDKGTGTGKDTKGKGRVTRKSKAKGKAKEKDPDPESGGGNGMDIDEDGEPEDPAWKREVHVRFLRAMHELDLLGFLKGAGRKTNHVLRTSFDAV